MAFFQSVFTPTNEVITATLAGASSGEIVFSNNKIIAISATAAINVRFGNSGMAAASAADFQIPAGQIFYADLNKQYDRLRIFGTATYWVTGLSRT